MKIKKRILNEVNKRALKIQIQKLHDSMVKYKDSDEFKCGYASIRKMLSNKSYSRK